MNATAQWLGFRQAFHRDDSRTETQGGLYRGSQQKRCWDLEGIVPGSAKKCTRLKAGEQESHNKQQGAVPVFPELFGDLRFQRQQIVQDFPEIRGCNAAMGFLKKFIRNVLREGSQAQLRSSFEHLSEEELEAHLRIAKYGNFTLTDAIRPSYDLQVVPREGYRHDIYRSDNGKTVIPVLMASVSKERLFDTFMELLDPLGDEVDVVLETSHNRDRPGHHDLYREDIDMPVLKSVLWEFEDLLLNDGCTGVAVLNPDIPLEVQFDEHKLLICYGSDLRSFERILKGHGIPNDEQIRFITEAEHVHSSTEYYARRFEELKMYLGMDEGCYV